MNRFVRRHLGPVDRMSEILFGLIMALGFTGAVRLGQEEPDSRDLFLGILGCNTAWALVDGVMYVLAALFERSRFARIARDVQAAKSREAADEIVGELMDEKLYALSTDEERRRFRAWAFEAAHRAPPETLRVRAADLLGGVAVAAIILMATAPMLVPYLVVADPHVAARISHGVGLAMLFVVGARWGRLSGVGAVRVGVGVSLVGGALVLATVLLGG
jgi:VIT1/CCC1 family predicted Fe2+/Mn2+ transporter